MADVRFTEERLRCWLDGNQPQRERLCLHLLSLLGDYSQVEPRRPKGGRDGGRDLQAIHAGELTVWGAVGFRNSPADSTSDKKWVKNKFNDDLQSALNSQPGLKGFVFFTNVDLTPTEEKQLVHDAVQKGMQHVRVFHRERLRLILDSPEGYGYRLQYLDIKMTREEQISFIERLESSKKQVLDQICELRTQNASQSVRLEFMHALLRPVTTFSFMLVLDREYPVEELGHFRVFCDLKRIYDTSPSSLYFTLRDFYFTSHSSSGDSPVFGIKASIQTSHGDEPLLAKSETSRTHLVRVIRFHTLCRDNGVFEKFGDLDGISYDLFLTEALLKKTMIIAVIINNYAIINIHAEELVTAEQLGLVENSPPTWPDDLSAAESESGWNRIYIRSVETDNATAPPPRRHASREIHFEEFTPEKVDIPPPSGGRFMADMTWTMS